MTLQTPPDNEQSEGFSFKAIFDVAVGVGQKIDTMSSKLIQQLSYLRKIEPAMLRPTATGVVAANGGPTLLDFGTPAQGTFWEVRQVTVGGVEVNTAAAGTGGLYVAASTAVVGGGMFNLVDIATSLPAPAYYPSGGLYVRANEHLFFVVFGGTVGQTYAGNAFVRAYQTGVLEGFIA